MTHSRYNQYLKEVQISHISLGWLCPISKTKLPICLRRFASGGFFVWTAFSILACLRHPFAFAIHQNGLFCGRTALLYEPFVSQLNSLLKQRVHGHNPLDAVAIHVHLKAIRSN